MTTREHLLREWEIIQTAREGFGGTVFHWFGIRRPVNPKLDEEQRQALKALVSNTNRVSIFRGGAGTGKSFVLRELADQIRDAGRKVVVLAPQRQQVMDMEQAGFPSLATVANFLMKRELAEGAAVIVDDVGQIGGKQMLELIRLVRERNARLILSGDILPTRCGRGIGRIAWPSSRYSGVLRGRTAQHPPTRPGSRSNHA